MRIEAKPLLDYLRSHKLPPPHRGNISNDNSASLSPHSGTPPQIPNTSLSAKNTPQASSSQFYDFDENSSPPSIEDLITAYGKDPTPVFFRPRGIEPDTFSKSIRLNSEELDPWDKVGDMHPFDLFHYLLEAPLSLGGLQLTSPLTIAAPASSSTWTELIKVITSRQTDNFSDDPLPPKDPNISKNDLSGIEPTHTWGFFNQKEMHLLLLKTPLGRSFLTSAKTIHDHPDDKFMKRIMSSSLAETS